MSYIMHTQNKHHTNITLRYSLKMVMVVVAILMMDIAPLDDSLLPLMRLVRAHSDGHARAATRPAAPFETVGTC